MKRTTVVKVAAGELATLVNVCPFSVVHADFGSKGSETFRERGVAQRREVSTADARAVGGRSTTSRSVNVARCYWVYVQRPFAECGNHK